MLVFVENIGHKYDFQEWGGGWSLAGSGGGGGVVQIQRKKGFNRLLIHISNIDG